MNGKQGTGKEEQGKQRQKNGRKREPRNEKRETGKGECETKRSEKEETINEKRETEKTRDTMRNYQTTRNETRGNGKRYDAREMVTINDARAKETRNEEQEKA